MDGALSRDEAAAILAVIETLPKRLTWITGEWYSVGGGKYYLYAKSDASYTTIRGWFKRAGASINQCSRAWDIPDEYRIEFYRAAGGAAGDGLDN